MENLLMTISPMFRDRFQQELYNKLQSVQQQQQQQQQQQTSQSNMIHMDQPLSLEHSTSLQPVFSNQPIHNHTQINTNNTTTTTSPNTNTNNNNNSSINANDLNTFDELNDWIN
jgi:transcription initiation factor TFIID subunit TAF12